MKHIISLGAGVQSSTMSLMFAHGELTPMPDCAIFADTGAEPRKVYEWLDWLEKQLPFPVYRVMHKDGLLPQIMRSAENNTHISQPPFFTLSAQGSAGKLQQFCTADYKIVPIVKKVRQLVGRTRKRIRPDEKLVTQYIGISLDEFQRIKPSRESWIIHQWPLIDKRMTRQDCLNWMQKKGYPMPSKSSCTFCPHHSDSLWRDIKNNDPHGWMQAVMVDAAIRDGVKGTTDKLYLHKSMQPLSQVDFRNASDMGQVDMFNNECEGMCGV